MTTGERLVALETFYSFEPIVAWRAYGYNDGALCPLAWWQIYKNHYFEGGTYMARCSLGLEPPCSVEDNDKFHACGFWGMKTLEMVVEYIFGYVESDSVGRIAFGPVLFTGRVIEHELGYRAEKMTVLPIEKVLVVQVPKRSLYRPGRGPIVKTLNLWEKYGYLVPTWNDTVMLDAREGDDVMPWP
jgi:hypothetical protein